MGHCKNTDMALQSHTSSKINFSFVQYVVLQAQCYRSYVYTADSGVLVVLGRDIRVIITRETSLGGRKV